MPENKPLNALEAAANGPEHARADERAAKLVSDAETLADAEVAAAAKAAGVKVQAAKEKAIDIAETAQRTSDVFGVILGTLTRLDSGQAHIEERMDMLVDTTNHRLDDFRNDVTIYRSKIADTMVANQLAILETLKSKADTKDLGALRLFWGEFRSNHIIQAVVCAVSITLAPVVVFNWTALIHSLRF